MTDRATTPARVEPVIDRTERISGIGRLIVLAFGLVGVTIGFALIEPSRGQPFIIGLLGILSVIGVVTLLAGAIGLIRFAGRGQDESVGRAFVDAMGEGVLLADRNGRIIYANRAYADLMGATSERDVPSSIVPFREIQTRRRPSIASHNAYAKARPLRKKCACLRR